MPASTALMLAQPASSPRSLTRARCQGIADRPFVGCPDCVNRSENSEKLVDTILWQFGPSLQTVVGRRLHSLQVRCQIKSKLMLAGQLGLFRQVPADLKWKIGIQVISADMRVGCICNAAVPDLSYHLPPLSPNHPAPLVYGPCTGRVSVREICR